MEGYLNFGQPRPKLAVPRLTNFVRASAVGVTAGSAFVIRAESFAVMSSMES